jgi:hypothetical protein
VKTLPAAHRIWCVEEEEEEEEEKKKKKEDEEEEEETREARASDPKDQRMPALQSTWAACIVQETELQNMLSKLVGETMKSPSHELPRTKIVLSLSSAPQRTRWTCGAYDLQALRAPRARR